MGRGLAIVAVLLVLAGCGGSAKSPRASEPAARLVAERGEQLEPARPDADGRRLDALLLDAHPMLDATAEEVLIRVHGLVEIDDGDAHVMDPACLHAVIV